MTIDDFLKEWRDGSPTLLVHTSGSTGAPKPLLVEKRRMEASARITCDFLGLREGDTALLCMSLDYIAGKMMVVRSLVRHLRLTVVEPSGYPRWEGALDFAAMVPLQVWNLLQTGEGRGRLMSIRHLIIGGGAISEPLADSLRTFPNAVWSTYGMTETLSHVALRRLSGPEASDWYEPFEGVGMGLDADGCLVIDAPQVCSQRLFTNDIGELAPDGRRFRILGRKDNVVQSGGVKIQIEQVERRLQKEMPVPFLITRRADSKFGEVVTMLVETTDAATTVPLCRACCERVLDKFEQPRLFVPVARLPLTATGKPARAEAARLAAESDAFEA